MATWTIEYNNETKELEKRLLCQPKTFSLQMQPGEVTITFDPAEGLKTLVIGLSEVVLMRVFQDVATKHMKTQGYTDSFINGYLSRDLFNHIKQMNWIDAIKKRIGNELNEAKQTHTLNLEALILFQTRELRKEISTFLRLCDDEVKEQLVHLSLQPFNEAMDVTERIGEADEVIVDILEEEGELLLAIEGEVRYTGEEIKNRFGELFIQSALEYEGILFQEYANLLLLILFAKLFGVSRYTTENEELSRWLTSFFKTYHINTDVAVCEYVLS